MGVGYYGYIGRTIPVVNINYEFDAAKNFTLAPFISYYSFTNYRYWGDPKKNYNPFNYYYNETAVPIGLKGFYYFDELLEASKKWDFYLAGSIGIVYRKVVWQDGYHGEPRIARNSGPFYLDLHLGTEFHLSSKAGLIADLSSGVSSFGLAIHF